MNWDLVIGAFSPVIILVGVCAWSIYKDIKDNNGKL